MRIFQGDSDAGVFTGKTRTEKKTRRRKSKARERSAEADRATEIVRNDVTAHGLHWKEAKQAMLLAPKGIGVEGTEKVKLDPWRILYHYTSTTRISNLLNASGPL